MTDPKPIPMLDVRAQNESFLPQMLEAIERVVRAGSFINGPDVRAFEEEVAAEIGVAHAIGVSSGTDAILAALMALGIGPGDEVITTPFTFFATAGCIDRVGARPIFVDIEPDTFNIDPAKVKGAITERTRAIIPVHLFGQSCDMHALKAIAQEHDLTIIEDAAQALGTTYRGESIGGLGTYGCFSFFPSKNLGGVGDGGLVTTNDAEHAEALRVIRGHGAKPKYFHHRVGGNFRLDTIQAAALRVKLPHLKRFTEGRRTNARLYDRLFAEAALGSALTCPACEDEGHVYNQYVIRTPQRDALQAHLKSAGIATAIYYPLPLHRQACFASLGYEDGSLPESELASREVLALPIFGELGQEGVERVAREVIAFLREASTM